MATTDKEPHSGSKRQALAWLLFLRLGPAGKHGLAGQFAPLFRGKECRSRFAAV
jgi:hypothetical protein